MATDGDGRIEVRGLTRRFGETVAVRPFDVDVGPGGVTGLLGPNGSGKSTLLRMLTGLVPPSGGTCTVDGVPLTGDGTAIRRRATIMPGEIAVYGELRGRDHLRWLLRGRDADAIQRAIASANDLGLPLERRVHGYSHGMKRQLFFAAALAPRVRVRILDEPTEGLDPHKRGAVLDLLKRDAALGTTVLLSSHHLGEVDRACGRLLFLSNGNLIREATPAELEQRARRHLRLAWSEPPGVDLERRLVELGAEAARTTANTATVTLAAEDPRPFLGALAHDTTLAAPTAIAHGELSLVELYREVYGVEGV